jgi:hypothetical protein
MSTASDDKDAIRELLYRYCFNMDRHLFADLGELFAPDGEWIAPYARATGPSAIAALMQRNVPAAPGRMHFTMNSVISLDADVLARKPGGWHFRRRELIHHIKGEMGLNIRV